MRVALGQGAVHKTQLKQVYRLSGAFDKEKWLIFFAQGLWRLCSGEHGSRRNRRGHAHHEQLLRKGPFPSRLASVLIIELPWPRRESVVEEETGPGGCVCETLL